MKKKKVTEQKKSGIKSKIAPKKPLIVISSIVLVLVIASLSVSSIFAGSKETSLSIGDVTILEKGTLTNAISATGTVESNNTSNIYSNLNYVVSKVNVEVGDRVSADDVLCELDSSTLEDQVQTKELSLSVSKKTAEQQLKTAQDTYNQTKTTIDNGTNSSMVSAKSSIDTAYDNWQKAKKTYEDYVKTIDNGTDSTLIQQNSNVESAQNALESAEDAVDSADSEYKEAKEKTLAAKEQLDAYTPDSSNNQAAYDAAKEAYNTVKLASDTAYEALKKADKSLETAEDSYDYAVKTRDAAYSAKDTTLLDYAIAADSAYKSYMNAQKSYDAAEASVKATLNSNQNSVASAQNSSDTSVAELELAQLREDIEETKIKAGVDGTVTAVYAKVGSSGSGLLFVVEDTDHLVINTSVKEYDIETVKTGMNVEIKSDATGDAVYQGTIESIAPTSNKTAQGETDKSGDIVFATKVSVTDEKTDLHIGMNVRLNYMVDKKENVLTVPYEAVINGSNGELSVLKLEKSEEGYRVRNVNVETELENDISMAISGTDISEGDYIINEPDHYMKSINETVDFITDSDVERKGEKIE